MIHSDIVFAVKWSCIPELIYFNTVLNYCKGLKMKLLSVLLCVFFAILFIGYTDAYPASNPEMIAVSFLKVKLCK